MMVGPWRLTLLNHHPLNFIPLRGLCLMLLCSAAFAQTCYDHIEPTTPESSFITYEDGTVLDKTTGLMWMRCGVGQTWTGSTCSGFIFRGFYWQDALREADQSEYAGYDDWRLPNVKELASIAELQCESPAINEVIFPATVNKWYWSSTARVDEYDVSSKAYTVDFTNGRIINFFKEGVGPATRLVREAH